MTNPESDDSGTIMPHSELPEGWCDVVGRGRMGEALVSALDAAGVAVRGPFTASTATQFKILGITIDATSAKFSGKGGQSLTAAEFFTQAVGQIVDVRGTATGSTVTASMAIIDPVEDR